MLIAILAALAAGLLNAVSAVMQRRAAIDAPTGSLLSHRLIVFLFRQPKWLVGVFLAAAAFGLQAVALAEGQLSLVQPLLMSEILFLLLILLVRYNEPIGPREWLGGVAISAGLGVLLGLANPHGGTITDDGFSWVVTISVCVGITAAAVGLTVRFKNRSFRAAVMGMAAGVLFALTAALTKLSILQLQNGAGAFFTSWPPYALLVTGIASMILVQNVFRAGPLAASQPAMMIADPAGSVIIGVLLFNDQLRHSPGVLAGIAVSALVLAGGIILLGGSPVITQQKSVSV